MVLNQGNLIQLAQETLAMSGATWVVTGGLYWAEAEDASKHPAKLRTACLTRTRSAHSVCSSEVERR